MPTYDQMFNALVTLMVTIDPPGLAPLFLVLTRGMDRSQRNQVAMRASIISFIVLSMFAMLGIAILYVFGITIAAFRVAGGFLLFYIAFEMIFERRQQRHEQSAETAITRDMIHNIAAFPLAIPLIAGPGAISATILLADASGSVQGRLALVGIIARLHRRVLSRLPRCRTRRQIPRPNRPLHPHPPARPDPRRARSSVCGGWGENLGGMSRLVRFKKPRQLGSCNLHFTLAHERNACRNHSFRHSFRFAI